MTISTDSAQPGGEFQLAQALQRFHKRNPKSLQHHESALQSLPGGNTRTLLHTAPFPVVMVRGEGTKLYDLDGHGYVDFVGELTAGLFGHSHPRIIEAMKEVLSNIGLNLGATNPWEKQYAELLCSRFNLESLRFANSGTEANLHCIGAARKFTGKRKVVVFRGAYHGSVLAFAFGAAPNNVDRQDWMVSQYNDPEALKKVFETNSDIAAVLVEAMQGSAGAIPGSKEFLRAVREQTRQVSTGSFRQPISLIERLQIHPGWSYLHPGRSHDIAAAARRTRFHAGRGPRYENTRKVPRWRHAIRRLWRPTRHHGRL